MHTKNLLLPASLLSVALAAPAPELTKRCNAPIVGGCSGGGGGGGFLGLGLGIGGGAGVNIGGILSNAFSFGASVTAQFNAIANVWISGNAGLCNQISAGLSANANADVHVSADVLSGAIAGCYPGYIQVVPGISAAAAAAIFQCDEKDVGYVKHEGSVSAGAGGSGGEGDHPASPVQPAQPPPAASSPPPASPPPPTTGGDSHPPPATGGDAGASAGGSVSVGASAGASASGTQKWYKHPKVDTCHQCQPCKKDD